MARHRSFKLDKFVKAVDDDLLRAYFTRHGLAVADGAALDGENVEKLLDSIKDEDKKLLIEEEMQCINDIADRSRNYLEDAIRDFGIQVNEDELSETTAMRVFLHSEEAFSVAYDYYLYVVYSEKLSHHQFKEGNCDFSKTKITNFKKETEQYFKDTGKSQNCDIRERRDRDRNIIFIARGDYMKTHLVFDAGKIKVQSFRPAKEDMLVFDKRNSVLSLNISGRSDAEKTKYIEIFGKTILGLSEIDDTTLNSTLVSLEPIRNGSFNYSGNEQIESVSLIEVRVKQRGAGIIKLTVNTNDVTQVFSRYGLSSSTCEYVSAKLRFFVRREGKKSKKITVEIKPPENTKLPEKKEKNIIEDYLRENGVLLV